MLWCKMYVLLSQTTMRGCSAACQTACGHMPPYHCRHPQNPQRCHPATLVPHRDLKRQIRVSCDGAFGCRVRVGSLVWLGMMAKGGYVWVFVMSIPVCVCAGTCVCGQTGLICRSRLKSHYTADCVLNKLSDSVTVYFTTA